MTNKRKTDKDKAPKLISGLEPRDYVTALSEAWQFIEINQGEDLKKYCFEKHSLIRWEESSYVSEVQACSNRSSEKYAFDIFVPSGKTFEFYLKAFAWGYYMWYSEMHDAMGTQKTSNKELIRGRKQAQAFADLFASTILNNRHLMEV
jgi:hypothetical protein